jgi:oligosaccharide repeat unit polymerase
MFSVYFVWLAICLVAGMSLFFTRFFLSPASFFNIITAIIVTVPLIFASDLNYSPVPLAYILFCMLSFSVGCYAASLMSQSTYIHKGSVKKFNIYNQNKIITVGFFLAGLGIILIYKSLQIDFNFSSFFSLSQAASTYYTRHLQNGGGLVANFFRAFLYLTCLVAGFSFRIRGKFSRYYFLPIIMALIYLILMTSKGMIVVLGFLYITGYCAALVYQNDLYFWIKIRKSFFRLIMIFIIFNVILYIAILERTKATSIEYFLKTIFVYYFVYLSAFCTWFDSWQANSINDLGLGLYTFTGFAKLLGFGSNLPAGLFHFVRVGQGVSSNVYTLYRSILQDFGFFFSNIILVIFGFFSTLAFKKVLDGHKNWLPFLCFFYYAIFYSFNVPITVFTTNVLAFVFLYFVLKWELLKVVPQDKDLKKSG